MARESLGGFPLFNYINDSSIREVYKIVHGHFDRSRMGAGIEKNGIMIDQATIDIYW